MIRTAIGVKFTLHPDIDATSQEQHGHQDEAEGQGAMELVSSQRHQDSLSLHPGIERNCNTPDLEMIATIGGAERVDFEDERVAWCVCDRGGWR